MADLGLYFGEDDEEQLAQEDKALSYLVLANEQDDSFDPVDTENLLAQMSAGSLISHDMELDEDTDVVQLLAEPNLSALEKVQLLAQSQYDFHRSFLARELLTILPQMRTQQAIVHIIPILRDFSLDPLDSVRETLASQLDKIMLYFLQHTVIDHNMKEPVSADSAEGEEEDEDEEEDNTNNSEQDTAMSQPTDLQDSSSLPPLPSLPHDTFTSIFMNLLLDQNAGIAHQTRLAVVAVAENVPDHVMESEILGGVIAGLRKLYNSDDHDDQDEGELDQAGANGEESLFSTSNRDEQDGEAELGKMLVVVLLTSLASLLGAERCTKIVIPKLEKFMNYSQFYVRKEIVMAVGVLCRIVSQDVVVNRLLPIYDLFVQDDTWHIRRACCTVLASFIGALPVEMKASKVEEIYDIFSVDVSRSVRNSIMEVLGEVIAGFEREKVPDSLLNHFLDMGQQPMNEHERAVMCAFSFPAVVLTAGPSKWELMKPVYMRLASTFRSPIRRSLACSLHEVAKILGPELADRDLALAFADCLSAEDEVKEGVLGHVVEFITCLSPPCRSDALHDLARAWTDLERSSNWRLRDSLTGQLSGLCEIAEGEDLLQVLLPLSVKACTDGVSTIRESGVMAFPALWEASHRVGKVPMSADSSLKAFTSLDFPSLDEDEHSSRRLSRSRSPFSQQQQQQQQELDDIEMEDVTDDTAEQSLKSATDSSEEEQQTTDDSSESSTCTTDDKGPVRMTTIQEQVIEQTTEFALHGGFRSRVVAVQIIQSLLDSGIAVAQFEEHFLPLLVDRLSVDRVINIRIWVARVVSWIMDSGYYGDTMVSPRLQDLLERLQQDPDRDVRIFSGGPAELPKPEIPEKSKGKKNKKKKKSGSDKGKGKGKKSHGNNSKRGTIFLQNPKNGQTDRIEEIGGESGTEIQLVFDGADHDGSEEDDGDEDDDDEGEEEEDSQESDSDDEDSDEEDQVEEDSSDEGDGSEDQPSPPAATTDSSIISRKARNRNSMGYGMGIMDGGKLIVSGKEIRTASLLWDSIPDAEEEEEDDFAKVEEQEKETLRAEAMEEGQVSMDMSNKSEPSDITSDITSDRCTDNNSSDADQGLLKDEDAEEEEDEEEEEEEGIADRVVPYTTLASHGVSPLDVETEESIEDYKEQHVPSEDDKNEKDCDKDETTEDKDDNRDEKDIEKETLDSTPNGPQEHKELPAPQPLSHPIVPELTGPSETAFPPLSPSSPQPVVSAWHLSKPLSYAASVKLRSEDSKARVSLALSSNLSSMTSFSQAANIPEPPCPSPAANVAAPNGSAPAPKAMPMTPPAPPKRILIGVGMNKRAQRDVIQSPSPAFPSLTSSSSSSPLPSSSMASPPRARTVLPFSYASVVASGAAAASRAFSPPMPPAITSPPAALTV
ncbi:Serine/threonine-protein phosphatase 4 regulatory subunit 1 [Mortierella alpina]|nr:Serine/threonine-protein phosphatase 4 regulatory subunit 1 [Mortierella alpina]